jgi:hypothetical protein
LNKPFEIVNQRELDHFGGKSRALRIDEFAFEFLREQHWPQFLAHLFEELVADPRTLPADDLDPKLSQLPMPPP